MRRGEQNTFGNGIILLCASFGVLNFAEFGYMLYRSWSTIGQFEGWKPLLDGAIFLYLAYWMSSRRARNKNGSG